MTASTFSVLRTGVIDGIKTTQELTIHATVWSDASRWLPVEGHNGRLYIVECLKNDSDGESFTYHYVCSFVGNKFYDYTRQVTIDITRWSRVRWAVI